MKITDESIYSFYKLFSSHLPRLLAFVLVIRVARFLHNISQWTFKCTKFGGNAVAVFKFGVKFAGDVGDKKVNTQKKVMQKMQD